MLKNESVRSDLNSVYETWRQAALKGGGSPVLLSTQEVAGVASSKRYVFTVVREIVGTSYDTLGLIAVDANIGVIESIVKDLDRVTHGTTLIVDDEGRVVFDSEKKYLGQNIGRSELLQGATGKEGSFHADVDGRSVLTIYRQSENTGWKILVTIPRSALMEEPRRIRDFTLLTAGAIIGFALLISIALTFMLTRPLRSLVRVMKEVQSGNLDVAFPVKRRDEVGLAGSAFNRMVSRIKSLIEDVYLAGQRKREAELAALQSQINPHFIYNTLEAIRMTAVIRDDAEVSSMAQLLGKLLRYGIGAGSETVPLAKEFEHLGMYVTLLNYRYGNRFFLTLPDEPANRDLPVMKLLFQPIVENAVYHGLDEAKPRMRIGIAYRLEGADHVFTVRDDGIGMDEAELARLRRRLEDPAAASRENRGIGLRNVNERLKLLFGETYGLRIESRPGEGTEVTVRLPAARREKGGGGGESRIGG
ncbi:sensor histidine kinase [Cohnella caldifontis]|uniref:sensor histidine kinase n=1 Tax=Cohnella caldifontis TaxID=3027471 RepID=UPI0023EBBEFA|nr:sensor histidine kinase [Cohnella sp. YIM B05605]